MSLTSEALLASLKDAHTYLQQTMEGVTVEIAQFQPEGTANPIAGTYAHLIFSEDFFLNFFLKKSQPLYESAWKDKTGISSVQPTEWVTEYPKWLREVKITIPQVYDYAKAVFAATEEYVATCTDEDIAKEIDMSMFHMGSRKAADVIQMMIIGHAWSIMGEIAVLKGIQGLKGYPF